METNIWNLSLLSFVYRSGDATARIWQIPTTGEEALPGPIVLKHLPALTDTNRDVTTMDWNVRLWILITAYLIDFY
jgi:transducin (beta)-like 1